MGLQAMKVGRIIPQAPPPEFTMQFSRNEGWAIVAALREWAERHPDAQDVKRWRQWAADLDSELRRDR